MRTHSSLSIVALLLFASAALAAPPYPVTTGAVGPPKVSISTAENVDNLLALANVWTVGITNTSSGTLQPLWTFNNTASGTAAQSIFSLQRAGANRWLFGVGDDSTLTLLDDDGSTNVFGIAFNVSDPIVYIGTEAGHPLDLYNGDGAEVVFDGPDVVLKSVDYTEAARVTGEGLKVSVGVLLFPSSASPPVTCNAGHKGAMYYDTSDDEFCRCKGASPAWASLGAGACS